MLDELKIKIQEKLNIEISSLRFLSSGNQCKIYLIESENKNYIAKKSEANSKNNLLIEAKMIEFLAKNSQILVPKFILKTIISLLWNILKITIINNIRLLLPKILHNYI